MQNGGGNIRVAWKAVDDATDYNVYMGDAVNPAGIEDSVADSEAEADGSFVWWSTEQAGFVYVRVTALNSLAEESAYSNERYFYMRQDTENTPTDALRHIMKGHKT
jgi:hypothetical protein